MKRILFVDDDVTVLDALKREFGARDAQWEVAFATNGENALAALALQPADVIVSDMRMPGMDGAALLAQVQESYPATVRVVLSDDADPATLARAGAVAHRLLPKPCRVDDLVNVVQRSLKLHEMRKRAELFSSTIGVASLPSRPGIYVELINALGDPRSTPDDFALVVGQDAAVAAKVLQLANSAFFGNGREVIRVRDAIVYLGANTLKGLTLSAEAFARFRPALVPAGFDVRALRLHSTLVARVAGKLVGPGPVRDDAVTAALLHDIGQLVLATHSSEYFADILASSMLEQRTLAEVERERSGVTHAEIGAYLLDLWGLPHGVVEAVAYHEDPSAFALKGELDAVGVVYIADRLCSEFVLNREDEARPPKPLDEEYIAALGVADKIDTWRGMAAKVLDELGTPVG
jgi:HD-like signal output (HDOD) protein